MYEITATPASTLESTIATIAHDPNIATSLLGALAATSGYQLVPARRTSHKRCATLSPYKSNGQKKATAAEPLREQNDFNAIAAYLRTTGNVRNRQRNYTLFICEIGRASCRERV